MSLTEILVVLGLFAFVLAISPIASINDFRSSSYQSDRDTLVDALLYARSKAQSGGCDMEGCGLHISTESFTVFEGMSYARRNASTDLIFPRVSDASLSGDTDILFLLGSGYVPVSARISFDVLPRLIVEITENGKVITFLES